MSYTFDVEIKEPGKRWKSLTDRQGYIDYEKARAVADYYRGLGFEASIVAAPRP